MKKKRANKLRKRPQPNDLDRIDYGILEALQKNARLSNKELAAHIGLAPSSCLERVRRLDANGALRGFHAVVDPAVLGIGLQALLAVRFEHHGREQFATFKEHVWSLPETIATYQVAGVEDYLVHVAVRDANHLRDLVLDQFAARPETSHIQTSLIFEYRRAHGLPRYRDVG
jgi:DNA-binding Lrp family transcriptional regulator